MMKDSGIFFHIVLKKLTLYFERKKHAKVNCRCGTVLVRTCTETDLKSCTSCFGSKQWTLSLWRWKIEGTYNLEFDRSEYTFVYLLFLWVCNLVSRPKGGT